MITSFTFYMTTTIVVIPRLDVHTIYIQIGLLKIVGLRYKTSTLLVKCRFFCKYIFILYTVALKVGSNSDVFGRQAAFCFVPYFGSFFFLLIFLSILFPL